MRWSAKKRIEFIEARLYWEGKISRKDLTDFFGISIPQATKDIKEYTEIAPNNIHYDSSAKQYIATPKFTPEISSPSSERYLTRLKLLHEKDSNKFFNGTIPSFSELPRLRRFVDKEVLRNILRAINNNNAIKISYQSMRSPQPETRWITPHSLGHDGSRWHVRSLCHNDKIYKDFNLGRIISIEKIAKHILDHSIDYEWVTKINLTIAPNPSLKAGPKSCIERDYCMENGQITTSIRAAFFYYFKLSFGVKGGHEDSPGNEQQVILLNSEEIKTQIRLMKSMTKTRINELPDFSTKEAKCMK